MNSKHTGSRIGISSASTSATVIVDDGSVLSGDGSLATA